MCVGVRRWRRVLARSRLPVHHFRRKSIYSYAALAPDVFRGDTTSAHAQAPVMMPRESFSLDGCFDMPSRTASLSCQLSTLLFSFSLFAAVALAQQQSAPNTRAAEQDDEVVRVSTELVQTDVMVFDKQGRFVEGLKPSQFELRVDGKPQPITFFEMVRAGSANEDLQLAAARGGARSDAQSSGAKTGAKVLPLDRGRTIFFFVDDLHLAPGNIPKTREMMLRFVNEQMGQNDEAAITSASGQIGFLQQLTGERAVLRAAVSRLNLRQISSQDTERPPMSEMHALAIERRDDSVFNYFVDQWIKQNSFQGERSESTRAAAEAAVRARARSILQVSAHATQLSLASLESLVRSIAPLPGRKIIFFISDGFLINEQASTTEHLRRVTDAAARSGSIIYAVDARGLTPGITDASSMGNFDPGGQLVRATSGEVSAAQEGLHALSADTGGRAILNTNGLALAVQKALKETEVYYILAWTPETPTGRGGKFRRLEVKVAGRPDLSVRVRRGFFDIAPAQQNARNRTTPVADKKGAPANDKQAASTSDALAALKSAYPRAELPTALFAGYTDAPQEGTLLSTLIQIEGSALDFGTGDKRTANIDLAGVVFDDKGKVVSGFRRAITVQPPPPENTEPQRITFSQQHKLPPGLYQVRVAAHDTRSGRTGSASQWVEIPDVRQGRFTLSSIFISERVVNGETNDKPTEAAPALFPKVDRRFSRTSKLQFVTSIYNASHAPTPDLALQVQLFRDDQPVVTTPLRKIELTGVSDFARIPYAAELSLNGLPAGQYLLQVTAIDRAAKVNASQRVNFFIE